jgi:diaminopropionate ammonia-lyase
MGVLKWAFNHMKNANYDEQHINFLNEKEISNALMFHKSFWNYKVTPLKMLSNLSKRIGVSEIYVKDESYRFDLNAFKVLGGSYAIGNYLAKKLNKQINELSFEDLKSQEVKDQIGNITFTSATDGNHGRGVAWAAQQLGHKAVIYMPKGSSQIRLNHILATGTEGYITDLNYDDAVRLSAKKAVENGWVVVQDTSWEGYEEIPLWIMQGYATLGAETVEQIGEAGKRSPTHIFLQAGVGSFAGSIAGYFLSKYKGNKPTIVTVEPHQADCFYQSIKAADGVARNVNGDMNTIMAGLACGEPNPKAWSILRDNIDAAISCSDVVAALGMRILGNPLRDDPHVISGESGAVTSGLLYMLMTDSNYSELKDSLKINEDSVILLINTEGDTDPENYRQVVWEGLFHLTN